MSTSPFEFTPEQKAVLEGLSQSTGEDICSLIARAVEKLQEEEERSVDETDYLLSSPKNAAHLQKALEDFQHGQRNFASRDLIEELHDTP